MIASAGALGYRHSVQSVLMAPEVDAVVIIYTPVTADNSTEIPDAIRAGVRAARLAGMVDKPVLACIMAESLGGRPLSLRSAAAPAPSEPASAAYIQPDVEIIPTYPFPERAVGALGKIAGYARWCSQPAGLYWGFDDINVEAARAICRNALAAAATGSGPENHPDGTLTASRFHDTAAPSPSTTPGTWLNAQDTCALLHAYGIPAAASALAHSADEAAALAAVVGFPVAAKIASSHVPHKTDIGGVRLNLTSAADVRKAFSDIIARARQIVPENAIDGITIQPMVADGLETIIGIAHDPIFGPLVGFGIGGIDVELLGDVRFRIAPLTDHDADELLHEIRGFKLLQGYRGRPAADVEALRDILLRVSRLAEDLPEIVELDLNPVMALSSGKGCRVVDARVRIAGTKKAG
jgi:acyl-CoA synthetase (NDP forming)